MPSHTSSAASSVSSTRPRSGRVAHAVKTIFTAAPSMGGPTPAPSTSTSQRPMAARPGLGSKHSKDSDLEHDGWLEDMPETMPLLHSHQSNWRFGAELDPLRPSRRENEMLSAIRAKRAAALR